MSDKRDFYLPANKAMELLYFSDNHYHYSAFCCDASAPHYGVITTTQQITTLGCMGTTPTSLVAVAEAMEDDRFATVPPPDPNDFKCTSDVGTNAIGSDAIQQSPTGKTPTVAINSFKITDSTNQLNGETILNRSFRLVIVPTPEFTHNGMPYSFPGPIYIADLARAMTNPAIVPTASVKPGTTVRKSVVLSPGHPARHPIYRLTITFNGSDYDTWLVCRERVN